MEDRQKGKFSWTWIMLIIALAFAARSWVMIGFGLGDDHFIAYTADQFLKRGSDAFSPTFGANYRLGVILPTALSFRLFGISDITFVLYPLIMSTLTVAVVFLIGKHLAGDSVGYFAALLQASSTFDITFASSMTIDMLAGFFTASTLLLLLKSEDKNVRINIAYCFAAAFALLFSVFIKLPSLSMVLALLAISVYRHRIWKKHIWFYVIFGLMLSSTLAMDYLITQNPFNRMERILECSPKSQPFWSQWLAMPNDMFSANPSYGIHIYGSHFWLALAASAYGLLSKRTRPIAGLLLIWFLVLFCFLEFYPPEWSLDPYLVSHKFFRHSYGLVAPAALISGLALADIWERMKKGGSLRHVSIALFILAFSIYCMSQVLMGWDTASLYKQHYDDTKRASYHLLSMPDKLVYADWWMRLTYGFYSEYERFDRTRNLVDGVDIDQNITSTNQIEALFGLSDCYVVVGGSRGVDVPPDLALNSENKSLPLNWTLVWEYPAPLDKYRLEPLRVYSVE